MTDAPATGEGVEAVVVRQLRRIADASRRTDGSDIPLGQQCREAAALIEAQQAAIAAAQEREKKLREAALQALDDMGAAGLNVCGMAKVELRLALGPMDGDPEAPEYSYDEALQSEIECDEMHGKPSGHRKEQRARANLKEPT